MALFRSIASDSWRAVQRALGIAGVTLTLGAGVTFAPAPADAAPAAAAPASALAAKPAGKSKAKKVSKRARAGARKAAKGSAKARRTARTTSRRRSGRRERSAERRARSAARHGAPTPRASADLVSVPAVVLPELALVSAPAGSGGEGTLTLITRSASSLLDGLLARARSQLGTRYVYGGADPDNALDCSSFARYVMEALNVRLPRTANQQARVGTPVPRDPAALRPGDLLTFGSGRRTSHVGIYLGAGRFIHASVKSGQVIETTIERNRSLFRRWQGARRLLAGAPEDAADSTARAAVGGSGG